MGSTYFSGYLEAGERNIDKLIRIQMQANFFPPIHPDFFDGIRQAVINCREGKDRKKVKLPNGKIKMSSEIVDEMHLDELVDETDVLY